MDVVEAMYNVYSKTEAPTGTQTQVEGEATLTPEKIGEMIDSATEQFNTSALNNKTEIEALKESIDTLTTKVNDISAGFNIENNNPTTSTIEE